MKKTALALSVLALIGFSGTSASAQDAAAGEKTAKTRCASCHTFDQGGANRVGPNLFGVIARGPGMAEGYNYSQGFKDALEKGFAWSDETLAQYLADPTGALREITGNTKARSKMTFKLPSEGDRQDVIGYLKTLQ